MGSRVCEGLVAVFEYSSKRSNVLVVALLLAACGGSTAREERAPRLSPMSDAGVTPSADAGAPALVPAGRDAGMTSSSAGSDAGASTACDTTSAVCDPVRNCGCPSGATCDLVNVAYSAVPVCRPLPAQ